MTKLEKMQNYLNQAIKINFDDIDEIKHMPQSLIDSRGGVAEWYATSDCSTYYVEVVDAIKFAGYDYPCNASVWENALRVRDEVVREKLSYLSLDKDSERGAIKMTKKEQVYQFLIDWYCDKDAAKKLTEGFYEYGCGVEEVDTKQYDEDEDYKSYIDSQRENLINDAALPGSGYWLIGGLI